MNYISSRCKLIFQKDKWRQIYKGILPCTLVAWRSKSGVINEVVYQLPSKVDSDLREGFILFFSTSAFVSEILQSQKAGLSITEPKAMS